MTGACGFDFCTDKIPNWYIMTGFVILLVLKIQYFGPKILFWTLIEIILVNLIFFPLYILGLFGGADIKLLGLLAIVCSVKEVMIIFVAALFAGFFASIVKFIQGGGISGDRRKHLRQYFAEIVEALRMRGKLPDKSYYNGLAEKEKRKARIHFSFPLLLGILVWGVG